MALMRTHDSSMKIQDRKLHVLLTMEAFRKADNSCFSAETNRERSIGMNFVHKNVYCKKNRKITKIRIYETFEKCFIIHLLNHIHNVVKIWNEVWYELFYRLF